MTKEKLIPQLRFKGFEGEWEEKRADQLFYSISSKNHTDLPVLSATQDHGLMFRKDVEKKIDYDAETLSAYKLVEVGDIVISLRSFQGGFELSNKKGIVSPAYTVIRYYDEKWNPYFWKTYFKSYEFIERLKTITYGIRDGRSISYKDFSSFKLTYPEKEEQQKIGSFFENLDKLIELYNQKIKSKIKYKKSLEQHMFPKENKNIPKFRYSGFEDLWSNQYFKDLFFYERPDKYIVSSEEYKSQGIPVLTANKAFILGYTDENNYYDKGNSIIFDDFTLDNKFVNFEYKVKSSAIKILTAQNGDLYFLYERLNNEHIVQEGHSRHYISVVQKISTKVPSLPEQQKIGQLFQKLDQEINLYEQKIEHLKQLKKGYLQKLFC